MFPVKLKVDIRKKHVAAVQPDKSDCGGSGQIIVECLPELLKG